MSESLAPDYDVPEGVSPFVSLPVLDLCRECRQPVEPFMLMNVVRGDRYWTGLCPSCAERLNSDD